MDDVQELASPEANDFWANDSCDSPLLGVNTPRSDEDRFKLMELMVFLMKNGVCDEFGLNAARLLKFLLSDTAEGFEQIIDFLSGSYINHALTVNPHVFISCIKQFWNTAVVKRSGDVTRIQALVDKKRIMITEELVREILQLNDVEGVVCLPNEEIFAGLARMGYEKPVGKGFSGVETPLFETMLAVRDVAEEVEEHVPAQGGDVQEHAAKEVATDVVSPTPTSPSPSSPVIPSLPPHQSPCPPQPQDAEVQENDKVAQQLEIVKLKARVKKLEKLNKGRISVDIDQDEGIELVVDHEKDVEVEGRYTDKQAEIYNIDLDHSSKVLVLAASTPILAAKPKTLTITTAPAVSTRRIKGVVIRDPEEELHTDTLAETAETPTVKDKGKGILIEAPKPMKKKDQVEMDAEYAKKLQEELDKEHEESYKNIDWNAALDHVQSKETQYIKRYHGIKKKPQTKFKTRKNMISYLKNTKGYKMEFFKGKTYDEILSIFQAMFHANMKFLLKSREEMEKEDEEIIKSINETPAQKAAKRRKLSKEAQEADDLRRRLEIVQDKDDDVFVEAIPLAQKVLVVDYQIVVIDNKPKIVKDRFSTSKPTNFSDEYLLLTLKIMFGELDKQDPIWRNQKSVHGLALVKRWKLLTSCGVNVIILSTVQLFLLVERRYPLSRFTLEQLVNVARLQVEEESEMSLEILRFTRQQL
uniref:Xylulose kinase-1 n=1 Tax=Tanacetum cinerariifolium TaxID=118510 RepID=A0A699GVE4_TANCI|nr:hypothetical protein [Tanacetum cinerariifolium]